MCASATIDEPELNLLFFVSSKGFGLYSFSIPMVNSGVAAMHVQLCPRNLSRELDFWFLGANDRAACASAPLGARAVESGL